MASGVVQSKCNHLFEELNHAQSLGDHGINEAVLTNNKSGTMIKFSPLDILGVSHRIFMKESKHCLSFAISAFHGSGDIWVENCIKYANEMTDDIIHLTQYYLKYINRAILANLQRRPLKLGRLIVL